MNIKTKLMLLIASCIFLLLLLAVIVGELRITFIPFSISMPRYLHFLGWLFITFAIVLFRRDAFREGYKQSTDDAIKILENSIKKQSESNKSSKEDQA